MLTQIMDNSSDRVSIQLIRLCLIAFWYLIHPCISPEQATATRESAEDKISLLNQKLSNVSSQKSNKKIVENAMIMIYSIVYRV